MNRRIIGALAIAMVGGVNAAATAAVLPLGAVWLLTRTAAPRRRSMMVWWPIFTLLATSWWLVPSTVTSTFSMKFHTGWSFPSWASRQRRDCTLRP